MYVLFLSIFVFLIIILGLHPRHRKVLRLGVEFVSATAIPDLSHVYNLHCWMLNPQLRPGIEPTSPGIPVGFVTPEPQWELLFFFFSFCWNIVDLHWCVTFRCTAKCSSLFFLSLFKISKQGCTHTHPMSHKKKDKDQDEVGKFSNLRIPLPESGGWKLAFLASLAVASKCFSWGCGCRAQCYGPAGDSASYLIKMFQTFGII